MHEAQMHERNCFITLTYDNNNIPEGMTLQYHHFRLFMRRIRKHFKKKIRFYMAGEYGDQFQRPHYHACLFGVDFDDKKPWRKNQNGDQLYRSDTLERLWKFGNSEIGAVSFLSAAYVARYVTKKITGDRATLHYTYIDEHGEIHNRTPEFNQMSRRPGIGAMWYEKFSSDVYPSDQVITRGYASRPPRYYDKLLERTSNETLTTIKAKRLQQLDRKDNTTQRLKAKETVQLAKAQMLKRTLS